MKILMLSSGDRVPSARFRLHPFVQPLRQRGHQVTLLSSIPQKYEYWKWLGFRPSQFVKRAVRRWHSVRARLQRFDVVVFDRELFDADDIGMEERFREVCPRMILDVDDAVFLRYPGKIESLARLCDGVIAGNRYLAEFATPHNSAVSIVPTCVPLKDYPEIDRKRDRSVPLVGWMGTTPNLRYLNEAAAALRALSARFDFELLLIVPALDDLDREAMEGVRIRHEVWDPQRETSQLRQADIGIMPLFAEEEWDKYKCGLKLIQYMAVGMAAVASPVGINAEIAEHGQCALLADSHQDWVDQLGRLLRDTSVREQLGQRARERVTRCYSIEANIEKFEAALTGTNLPQASKNSESDSIRTSL